MVSMGQEVSSNTILGIVWQAVSSVGWYLVIGLNIAFFYLKGKYDSWKPRKLEYVEKYHKDPDAAHERLSAVVKARERMQLKYEKDVELALKKEEEIRERKKQELLNRSESGNRLGGNEASGSSKSKLLKEEYNPLMGDSRGSRSYRPQRRSRCGKGGCG